MSPLLAMSPLGLIGAANDISVALDSMNQVPSGRKNPMKFMPSQCDQLTYFRSTAGLSALDSALHG
jgi:hypothetical protein